MAVWTDSAQTQPACPDYDQRPLTEGQAAPALPSASPASGTPSSAPDAPVGLTPALHYSATPTLRLGDHGWPVPSSLSPNPDEARACIQLPEFDAFLLEKARVISGRFPFAEAEFRNSRGKEPGAPEPEIPHFEKIFRLAAAIASVPNVQEDPDYDTLLILTAWHSVRPETEGFLASYPKALLCPLSHTSPPVALASLSTAKQCIFERRAPAYLRYLLCEKFGLRTCADIENADLRHLLRSTGFRLIRSSAVAEVAFPGITRGDDPPVRPWKLTLRQELSDPGQRGADVCGVAALLFGSGPGDGDGVCARVRSGRFRSRDFAALAITGWR